jgi:ubiquinone/menaquinone biosynthesis C-methylase UbiE
MPDVWAAVAELDPIAQQRMADVLETRGADPRQREMRQTFLADIAFPPGAEVLEVGCGTGVLTRVLAALPEVDRVVGVDIAESLLDKARELTAGIPGVTFEPADARSLPYADGRFHVVVFDSTLSHVPEPERAVREGFRVLRPDGLLAAFDGDYATATVALAEHDPLQTCVDAMLASSVTDRRVMRRLPGLLRRSGFDHGQTRSHGFVETGEGGYMLTIVDRGADLLAASGAIGEELALSLKAEARRRAAEGGFFGHIAYASVIAGKANR